MNLKMQVLVVVSLCCCAVVITKVMDTAAAHPQVQGEIAESPVDRSVSTSGTVTMSVMPDTIYWNISLRDRHAEAITVKKASDEKLNAILALQNKLGIDKDDLQICHMQLSKRQESRDNGRTRIEYFEVTRNVTIRETDLKRFDEMLNAFVGVGGVEVSYRMANSNSEEIRRSVRRQALQVAQEKAQSAANELGVKLGAIRTVKDHRPSPDVSSYGGVSRQAQTADIKKGVVAPSAIDVTATVDVVFDLM